jgi:hypothetical protein
MFGIDNVGLEILLLVYIVIQVIAAIYMSTRVTEEHFIRSLLVLPLLWDYYTSEMNTVGAVIATVFTTLFFLPALLVCYAAWVAIISVGFVLFLFKELFRKHEDK